MQIAVITPELHMIIKENKGYRLVYFLIRYDIQYDILFNKFHFTMCLYEDTHAISTSICLLFLLTRKQT